MIGPRFVNIVFLRQKYPLGATRGDVELTECDGPFWGAHIVMDGDEDGKRRAEFDSVKREK